MRRLLIIDDELEALELIRQIFTEFGYRVFSASRGKEGLELARRTRPDLVLLDLRLPDMKGEEVLQAMRKELPQTKVIVGSGYVGDPVKKDELRALGAVAVYDKPIVIKEFRKAVSDHIGFPTALKVLVIDDNREFAEEISFFFKNDRSTQWEFHTATTGEEGLAKIPELWPDLVLLDLVLSENPQNPYHSGVQVFEEIKKKYSIPVVIVAGHPDAFDAHQLTQHGIAAIFSKDELIGGPESVQHILDALKGITLTWAPSGAKSQARS